LRGGRGFGGGRALAQALIVAADKFGIFSGNWIAIQGRDLAGVAAGEFFGDALADFHEGADDARLHEGPFRRLAVAFELGTDGARAVEGFRDVF
jgi:hypothetical protein